ncbi:hypothetical protein, partial [Methylophaga sp.]|uniref:hypothetical protein n=1 Tax=Methylophaga sp. TaxID=2024840 RepID=UPI002720B878
FYQAGNQFRKLFCKHDGRGNGFFHLCRPEVFRKITIMTGFLCLRYPLEFDSNPIYQTDLLGESNDTSETSALIDGILGANQLLIQRQPDSWDIKRVDEADSRIKEVLKLLRETLIRKREKPYPVVDLREQLVSPPYGIPACNLAMLAAIAIRHDVPRLRWGSCGTETDFAVNLNTAFVAGSKLTIRLHDFSPKQLKSLQAVSQYFGLTRETAQTDEDFAGQAVAKLRDFISHKPGVIKQSPQLHQHAKELVKLFNAVGKTQQDIAEKLLELFGTENAGYALKTALDDFARLEDAKRHEIEQSWQAFLSKIGSNKTSLILRLTHEQASPLAKKVGHLLGRDSVNSDDLALALLDKIVERCEERDIHRCLGQLDLLVDYHPPQSPSIVSPHPHTSAGTGRTDGYPFVREEQFPPASAGGTDSAPTCTAELVAKLRQQIDPLNLPSEVIKSALHELLRNYEV